jgi:hypothetical protein
MIYPTVTIDEEYGYFDVGVVRYGGTDGITSASYTASNGSAVNPTNYTLTTGSLAWANGEDGMKNFTVNIVDVPGGGPTVAFTASFYDVTNSNIDNDKMIISILNTDPFVPGDIGIQYQVYNFEENEGVGYIGFVRTGGTDGAVSAAWQLSDGTAKDSINYWIDAGQVNWADGDATVQYAPIDLIDDGKWHDDITYGPLACTMSIMYADGGAGLLPNSQSTKIEILNINPKKVGTMSFVTGAYSVAENTPGYVTVQVQRLGGSDGGAEVDIVEAGGTAQATVDYGYVSNTLIWAHQNAETKSINIPIYNNEDWVGTNKYFTASIGGEIGAVLGTVSKSIITIVNDDLFVPTSITLTNESLYVDEPLS